MNILLSSFAITLDDIILITIAFICIGLVIVYYKWRANYKKALQAYATSKGWQYSPKGGDPKWITMIDARPFGEGSKQSILESISFNKDGRTGIVFNYCYETGSSLNLQTGNLQTNNSRDGSFLHTVLFLETGLHGVLISLDKNNLLLRVIDSITNDAIKFDNIDFNKNFKIRSEDEIFAKAVITPQMMEAIVAFNPARLVWGSGYLLYVSDIVGLRWNPKKIDGVIAGMESIVNEIPNSLLNLDTSITQASDTTAEVVKDQKPGFAIMPPLPITSPKGPSNPFHNLAE